MKATTTEVKRWTKNTIEARQPARPGHRPVLTDKEIIEDQAEQIRALKFNVKRWKGMYEKAVANGQRWAESSARLRARPDKQRLDSWYKRIIVGSREDDMEDTEENEKLSAEVIRLRGELEKAKSDVERWAGSSGFYSDSLAMEKESAAVLQAERDKYAAALVEIRGICTAMMDGWGQTVTVLDKIRKITLTAIKRQPTEPAHRPETFA